VSKINKKTDIQKMLHLQHFLLTGGPDGRIIRNRSTVVVTESSEATHPIF
jgi:hypothetical protein